MTATHGLGTYGNAVGTVTPLDMKMAQLGLIVKTAANTIRAGVFWDGNATIVSGKANMSYDVRALAAVLSRGATSGAVPLTNDAVYNVTTTAAPGSNSRYDVVYLWQREYSIDGTDSNPVIGVIQGTAAASPSVPALTAFPGAIELARILVPAGVTATNSGTTITQTAPFTAAAGGVVVARTTTERDVYVPASTDLTAQCLVLADGVTYRWNGTTWKGWHSDWVTYAPTLTGVTVGNGTSAWSYKFVSGEVFVKGGVTLGSTSSVTAAIEISLPVTRAALTHPYEATPGSAALYDVSASTPYVVGVAADASSTTAVRIYPHNSGIVNSAIGAAVPFTWASGDSFSTEFTYRAA